MFLKSRRLQYVRGSSVVNMTPFGRDLRKLFFDNIRLLEGLDIQHGWIDGGCWTLAQTIREWAGDDAELFAVCNSADGSVQHIVARLFGSGCFVDGDGVSRGGEMIQKMQKVEQCKFPMDIRPFVPSSDRVHDLMILLYVEVVPFLTQALVQRFGMWRDAREIFREVLVG